MISGNRKKKLEWEGKTFKNISGSEFVILEYTNWRNVLVKFSDEYGYEVVSSTSDIKNGKVKNLFAKNVKGVGFLGSGRYKTSDKTGGMTKEYAHWVSMLDRCYNTREDRYRSYMGCSVDELWHNFQVFADWCQNQKGFKLGGWELDKDLLTPGNKVYSHESCIFVPSRINLMLNTSKHRRGDFPIGVYLHELSGKYMARCGTEYLGLHETPIDAFLTYKRRKEQVVRGVAMYYKKDIDERVFDKLMEYEVNILD